MTHGRSVDSSTLGAILLVTAALLAPFGASAQDDAPLPPADVPAEEAAEPADSDAPAETEASAPAEEKPAPRKGDVVTLKNGKILSGVQVVRETPTVVEVQVVPGVEPMSILRRQVANIEYDALAASDVKEGGAGAPSAPAPGGKGELSPELAQKLGTSITDAPLDLRDRDVVEVVTELASKVDAPLEITPEVQKLPERERAWTATIPADTSLMSLLREWLPKSFPDLDVEIANDRVRLRLKSEGATEDGN